MVEEVSRWGSPDQQFEKVAMDQKAYVVHGPEKTERLQIDEAIETKRVVYGKNSPKQGGYSETLKTSRL